MTGTDERLIDALTGLSAKAPRNLMGRIAARWSYVEGPVEDAFVAFTTEGISSVVPASRVPGYDGFAAVFGHMFGQPLLPADRPPQGLEQAMRSGRATGLRFDLRGRTPFERAVLEATLSIPPGELRPYSWVAGQIDRPRAVRAVGTALGHNPVPLLIPCHRVIRADGTMGHYGFGPEMKRRLLDGEGIDVDRVEQMVRGGATYVGDEGSRVVCMPTCHRLAGISAEDRRGFRSLADAEAAGYRPCPRCRPAGR